MARGKIKQEKGSQPVYKVKVKETVYVPMRDGVKLAVDIYRPDAAGKFPALLALGVYGKDLQALPQVPQPRDKSLIWDGTIEAGDTGYLVSRGYVHVIADVRGTGDSEGEYVGMCGKSDGEDGYDLVEWIARQPWCSGKVGMIGISYLAGIQIYVAAEQPPHLTAIFPWELWSDLYSQMATEGGVIKPMLYRLYAGRGMDPGQTNGSGIAHKNIVSATVKNTPAKELNRLWQERLNDPDLRMYPIFWSVLRYPTKSPIFADFLFHPDDGPFYWERTPWTRFDKIKIPFYTGGPWLTFWPDGAFGVYCGIDAPKKIMMSQSSPERPWYDKHDEIVRWYDYWLKGIDTGIMDEPPIKLWVNGINEWRHENEWPLARSKWTRFYLRSRGRLKDEAPVYNEGPDCFVQQPLDQTSDIQSLKYSTSPFNGDTEIIGPLALYLYASIDTDDTNWFVRVRDVDGQGKSAELTETWLKASHRAIDKSKSETWRPWHIHSRREPAVPGKVYEYVIGIPPTANVFRQGHRMEIEIASMDNVPGGLHICSSKTTLHKIHHDPEYASFLLVPVIPGEE